MAGRSLAWILGSAVLFGAAGSGCAVVPELGLIYSDVGSPEDYDPQRQDVELEGKRHEMLGRVQASVELRNYFGVVAVGGSGYADLYRRALDKMPGANMLVDVRVDHQTRRIVTFYIHRVTTLEGMAVRVHAPKDPGADDSSR